jgi:hypothetical protein
VEGTNTGHENAEGMASVGVRLTAELGHACCAKRPCPSSVMALPLPERWRAPMGVRICMTNKSSARLECPRISAMLQPHWLHIKFLVDMGRNTGRSSNLFCRKNLLHALRSAVNSCSHDAPNYHVAGAGLRCCRNFFG